MKHRIILTLALLIAALSGFGQTYDREIYISSSEGSDTNPGTVDAPRRTISGLTDEYHRRSKILLKRGDVFFDCFHQFHDSYIGAYGVGDMPVVSGFRVLVKPSGWEKVSGKENVWKIDLNDSTLFKGIDKSFELKPGQLYNIGCMYVPSCDSIFGHIVSSPDSLTRDGDMFTSAYHKSADIAAHPFGEVLIKLPYSPGCLGAVCFSTFRQAASTILNCRVCDIAFVGYSNHGASSDLTGSTFTGCTFDIIGGAVLPDNSRWARFGNAVELWANKPGKVCFEGCLFSRTFAAAIAFFGSKGNTVMQYGLKFIGNTMYRCSEGLEISMNIMDIKPVDKAVVNPGGGIEQIAFIGCEFYNNILYGIGQNGFNSPGRPRVGIFIGSETNQIIPTKYNLFFGGNYCNLTKPYNTLGANDVWLYPGQDILVNGSDRIPISAVEEYRRRFPKDNSSFSEIVPGDSALTDMARRIEDVIGWQPPRLKLYQLIGNNK